MECEVSDRYDDTANHVAAGLRASVEMRELTGAPTGKPVAGEWGPIFRGVVRHRRISDKSVAAAGLDGSWNVKTIDGTYVAFGDALDMDAAMLAADTWARANPDKLDWVLPPAAPETPAPTVTP